MRPHGVVVALVFSDEVFEMALAEDDEVIQTLLFDGLYKAFCVGVQIGGAERETLHFDGFFPNRRSQPARYNARRSSIVPPTKPVSIRYRPFASRKTWKATRGLQIVRRSVIYFIMENGC